MSSSSPTTALSSVTAVATLPSRPTVTTAIPTGLSLRLLRQNDLGPDYQVIEAVEAPLELCHGVILRPGVVQATVSFRGPSVLGPVVIHTVWEYAGEAEAIAVVETARQAVSCGEVDTLIAATPLHGRYVARPTRTGQVEGAHFGITGTALGLFPFDADVTIVRDGLRVSHMVHATVQEPANSAAVDVLSTKAVERLKG